MCKCKFTDQYAPQNSANGILEKLMGKWKTEKFPAGKVERYVSADMTLKTLRTGDNKKVEFNKLDLKEVLVAKATE